MQNAEIISELAKCIDLFARDDAQAGGRALITLAKAVWEAGKNSTAEEASKKGVAAAHREIATRLFAYWQEQCQHPRAKLTPERGRCIVARLKEGYSEADIRTAINGAAEHAYQNENGQTYDDITLICRNGSKLESFIARGGSEVSDVDAVVEEAPLETKIRDTRRAMAKAITAGDNQRYEELNKLLVGLLSKR